RHRTTPWLREATARQVARRAATALSVATVERHPCPAMAPRQAAAQQVQADPVEPLEARSARWVVPAQAAAHRVAVALREAPVPAERREAHPVRSQTQAAAEAAARRAAAQ